MQKKALISLLWALVIIMILNAALSGYVYYQKQSLLSGNDTGDTCFSGTLGQGSCADVQFSEYGSFLGLSVSLWGVLLFAFMAIVLGSLAYSLKNNKPISGDSDLNFTRKFCLLAFGIAILSSLYFIYLQFFVLDTICKYCMVIDTFTIVSGISYITTFKKGISFFLE